jgi:hypothetical protein
MQDLTIDEAAWQRSEEPFPVTRAEGRADLPTRARPASVLRHLVRWVPETMSVERRAER